MRPAMQIRNSFPGKIYAKAIETLVLPKLSQYAVTPDHLTFLGLFFALLVPFGFYFYPLWGLVFMIISGVSDSIDGMIARNSGVTSDFGAFLDSSMDRFSDFLYLFGFWVLFWNGEKIILSGIFIFISMVFSFMVSYLRARAEGLGYPCNSGLMERGLRTVYLLIWALVLGLFPSAVNVILWTGLILYCVLTLFTVIQRILAVKAIMNTLS